MEPGLYIVGTPIGNLQDITLRALQVLREADVVFAEDTRHTRILFQAHGIGTPLVSCHKFNEAARLDGLLDRIAHQGQAVALVSDAGMPLVADPGSRLVRRCRERGLAVLVVPGPSAVSSAIAWSGLGERGYCFGGFLPVKPGARARRLERLLASGMDVVVFESPHRILRLMEYLSGAHPACEVAMAREITKKFEECRVGSPTELLAHLKTRPPRGEFTVVIRPGAPREEEDAPGDVPLN